MAGAQGRAYNPLLHYNHMTSVPNPKMCRISFEDGADALAPGQLVVTAETPEAKMNALEHFKGGAPDDVRARRLLEVLGTSDPLVLRPRCPGSSQWFCREVVMDDEWTAPYIDLLRKRTGWPAEGEVIDVENVHHRDWWGGLRHTFYPVSMEISHNCLVAEVVITGSDWLGKTASERAQINADRALIAHIAETIYEPEFIQCGNLYRRNPKYATGNFQYRPAVKCEDLFHHLVEEWLTRHANDTQREVVRISHELNSANHHGESSLHDVKGYGGLRWSWHHAEIPWADFQSLTPESWEKIKSTKAR